MDGLNQTKGPVVNQIFRSNKWESLELYDYDYSQDR